MGKIKVLPEELARQIAAGEVVERPASVIKELIENALDAGSTSLTVRTAGAGVRMIEVHDDGCGMSREDVDLAPKNFSTSKIASSEDLFSIRSYGFRGEALSSISAVARLDIVSSDNNSGEGWRNAVKGKTPLDNSPAAHEKGTTIKVQDLFFNTPARKKFLKSEPTERRRILESILSFAMMSPELEVHYTDDDKPVLDLIPNASWKERVAAILGASTMKHMVEVDSGEGELRVRGFVSLPTYTRANRSHQYLYVNRRFIREKTIISAVQEAYRTVIPYKRFPVVVLALDVPYEDVDVNVHPNKLEIRLDNPRRVHDTIRRAIKRALSAHSESDLGVSYTSENDEGSRTPALPHAAARTPGTTRGHILPFNAWRGKSGPTAEDYKTRAREAADSYMSERSMDVNPQLSLQTQIKEPLAPTIQKVQGEEGLFWQFNNAYIFIQVRGGIVIIDQHAAHERIIFDTSKRRLANEIPVSQQILFPINLELSIHELDVFKRSKDLFRKLGFHLEPFGGKSILVRGYPQGLKNWNEGKLLLDIFDDIIQDRVSGETHADRIIASFACRSAVKAGQKLALDEMKMLADQLFAVPNPYSCPHGRPTIQRIALEEIESWFLRR